MDKMISKIYPVFLVGVFLFLMMATVRPSSANQADAARPSPDQLQYEPLFFELPKAHRVVWKTASSFTFSKITTCLW
jgi:hypothetical protein